MKPWVYGAIGVTLLLITMAWGYKKWHVHQYCKMTSEQLVCTRVVDSGLSHPWCVGDYERGLSNLKYRHNAGLVKERVQEFLQLSKTENIFKEALPKARELAYHKCMAETL
ncbi:hypothetical protein ACK323_04830 [Aeromonas enteropelogenes]|uniref:hypothetical protein n=1 Tax=Aeromonas enteropelogenes TaxID=29489 RepID=UPI003988CDEB